MALRFNGCALVPPAWRPRKFSYNALSELLSAYNPETGSIRYSYDADGNVATRTSPQPNQRSTSAAAVTFTYCYDALNRLLAKGFVTSPAAPQQCTTASPYLSNPFVTNGYDGPNSVGLRTTMADASGHTTWNYDALGRVASEQRTINPGTGLSPVTKSVNYQYDMLSNLAQITYPSGAVINYTDVDGANHTAGRYITASDPNNNIKYVQSATYAPDGKIASFLGQAGGTTITNGYAYNSRLQICREVASTTGILLGDCKPPIGGNIGNVLDFAYDFHVGDGTAGSDNGNLFTATNNRDTTRSQSYTYDSLNRLLTAQTAGMDCTVHVPGNSTQTKYWGESFTYDTWGNLTAKNTTMCNAESTPLVADVNNRLSAYGYDAAGNMLCTGGATMYAYDAESELATTVSGTGYLYDGDGNRVEKFSPLPPAAATNGTLYWYGGLGILTETDLAGNPQSDYIFFDGERVARRDLTASTKPVYYYFSNQIHSTAIVTDANGSVQDDSDYYPFGGEVALMSNLANHYKFAGKERDAETGLDYFGARYYSNTMGRWITPDYDTKAVGVPYADFTNPQTLNLYGYVFNNPITRVDKDGHCPPCGNNIDSELLAGSPARENSQGDIGQAWEGAKKEFIKTVGGLVSLFTGGRGGVSPGVNLELENADQKIGASAFVALTSFVPEGEAGEATTIASKLRGLTNEAHDLLGFKGKFVSTSVGQFADGSLGIASSDKVVPQVQQAWAEARGIRVINGAGHAEITLKNGGTADTGPLKYFEVTSPFGREVVNGVPTNPNGAMCGPCSREMQASGASTTSPTVDRPSRNAQ